MSETRQTSMESVLSRKVDGRAPAYPVALNDYRDAAQHPMTGMPIRLALAQQLLAALIGSSDNMPIQATDPDGIERERLQYRRELSKGAIEWADALLEAHRHNFDHEVDKTIRYYRKATGEAVDYTPRQFEMWLDRLIDAGRMMLETLALPGVRVRFDDPAGDGERYATALGALTKASGYKPRNVSHGVEQAEAVEPYELLNLRNEINCRIEHGADGEEHLRYVQSQLDAIIAKERSGQAEVKSGSVEADLRKSIETLKGNADEWADAYSRLCRVVHKHLDPLGLDPLAPIEEVDAKLGAVVGKCQRAEANDSVADSGEKGGAA